MHTLKQRKLVDEVIDSLLEAINSGQYKPGDRIPSLNELTKITSVSRNTIREALTRLESLGILRIKQGDGTYVNKLDIDTMMSKIAPNFLMDEKSLLDMVEVRMTIEQDTAYIAAQRIDEENITNLQSIVEQMQMSLGDPLRFMELDFKFHYEIAKATKNNIFTQLILFIQDTMKEQQIRIAQKPSVIKVSLQYHKDICKAITSHDAEHAKNLMREHLTNVPFRFLENIPSSLKKTINFRLPHSE